MSAPKKRHSDARKPHMPELAGVDAGDGVVVVAGGGRVGGVADRRLHQCSSRQGLVAPSEDAGERDDPADGGDPPATGPEVDAAVPDEHDADAGERREVRRRRHVDAVAVVVAMTVVVAVTVTAAIMGGRLGDRRRLVGPAGRDAHQATVLVLGVLAVPEVVAAMDHRDLGEVVFRRRVRDRPLQGAGVPGVCGDRSGDRIVFRDVDDEEQDRQGDGHRPDGGDQVPEVPAHAPRGTGRSGGAGPGGRGCASGRRPG